MNITGLAGRLTRESSFSFALQDNNALSIYYTNIGGSVIGELLFNFGIVGGLIASVFFGIFIGVLSRKINEYLDGKKYLEIFIYVPTMCGIIYWIRDYFGGQIRPIVWGMLISWISIQLLFKNREKNNIHRV